MKKLSASIVSVVSNDRVLFFSERSTENDRVGGAIVRYEATMSPTLRHASCQSTWCHRPEDFCL
jgi:hypothetical protein